MDLKTLILLTLLSVVEFTSSQNMRVAPGVPPQHYDPNLAAQQQYGQGHGHPPPPPPPQHQQPYHSQQNQVPIQQQQYQQQQQTYQQPQQQHPGQGHHAPQQPQGHAPQPHGQAQPAHGHGHGRHGEPQQVLDTSKLSEERQHIQDHMSVPIDTSQMTEQELQFHYFKMHDVDNNNKLDGCELVKSLIHWHDESNHDPKSGHPAPEPKLFTDDELVNMIDPILQNDDKNRDGFIDYAEFVQAQAAAASRSAASHAA